VKGKGQGLI